MANLSIGVAGAWKQVQKVSIGVGGVWKDVWQNLSVDTAAIGASRLSTTPTNATATAQILNDGTWSGTTIGGGTTTGTWLLAGTAAEIDVYVTGTGDTPTGSAINTWLNLGTSRSWTLTQNVIGVKVFTGTAEFRSAATLATLGTVTFTIDAEEGA